MLDIRLLRNEFDRVKQALAHRGEKMNEMDSFSEVDLRRRELLQESEQLKRRRNNVSQEVAQRKKAGEDAEGLIIEMREVGDRIKQLDEEIRELELQINQLLLSIPNIPHESVPIGESEDDNVEVRRVGELPSFDFEPKPHWDIATDLDIS